MFFLASLLKALLLASLLLGLRFYFIKTNNPSQTGHPLNKYPAAAVVLLASFTFISFLYLIDYWLPAASPTTHKYLNADEQYKIGKAFYYGEGLPKDNQQALNWLLYAAQQDHPDAKELIQTLGVELEQQVESQQATYSDEEKPSLAVDVIPANHIKTTLKDIAGMEQPKKDIEEFLNFIQNPEQFTRLGAKPPKGILIYGPPGTGKTLLARATAGQAKVTFIAVAGSAFEETYVGKGAARIRELFDIARKNKPAIIFIDEIDALAPARKGEEISLSQIQAVNQLLAEMQNINEQKNSDIYVMAATNRLESLDPALLRPGRFDWQIHMGLPTDKERQEILKQYITKIKTAQDVKIENLVALTAGFSGADLANLVNEAALVAGRLDLKAVNQQCFEVALKKITTYEKALSPGLALKILSPSDIKIRLSQIAGMNETKKEVAEVIDYLKDPKAFTRLGAKPPKGILMYGPPGVGKTMMARAIAGEANVSFIATAGSSFDEKYVGVGAARVRELFSTARKYKPCIIFIDEIDGLLANQGSEQGGRDQTINQFLTEMDNIQNDINEGIIILGATNKLNAIDPAALRPGRFDRKVYFRYPTLLEREAILKSHLANIHYDKKVDVSLLAKISSGYSGADLANWINEAAIDATRKNKPYVDMASFEAANDKIALGVAQDNVLDEKEKKLTAYHEAGHALVGILVPDNPRVLHKMTIGLRNESLGVTHFRYEGEKLSFTKKEFEALIATALGGYIAEELIYGKENVTSGAASDLIQANEIAKEMVTRYAMGDDQDLIMSDVFPSAEHNDAENAEKILVRDYELAKSILQKNMDKLHLLANALLERETLDYEEILSVLNLKPKRSL